jgi:hypothetical protein
MTTVNNILKEVYEDRLRDQLQSETISLMRIDRTSEGVTQDAVGGKYTTFPVRVKRNHAIGARLEMEALPTPRTQGYEAARINLKYLYGSIQLTGQTFELAETNRQAFASAVDQEIEGMREGLRKDTNRQVYGTPEGVLVTATANGSTTTIVTTNTGAQYMEVGMYVDFFQNDDDPATTGTNKEITAIAADTPGAGQTTITFTPAAGEAINTGYYATRQGNRNKEKTGFESIVIGNGTGGGALYNITHAVWTANVDSTAGVLSEGRMINMVHRIRRRGGRPSVGFTSEGVQRAYFNLLVQQRRYTNTTEFAGGFRGLAFTVDGQDIPIVPDWDCQAGRMYFIAEKEIKLYQAGDWSFMNRDGSRWQRVFDANGRYDAYLADFYKYCELGTHRRNAHGVLTNVTEA